MTTIIPDQHRKTSKKTSIGPIPTGSAYPAHKPTSDIAGPPEALSRQIEKMPFFHQFQTTIRHHPQLFLIFYVMVIW
jgi:hypothetical protein